MTICWSNRCDHTYQCPRPLLRGLAMTDPVLLQRCASKSADHRWGCSVAAGHHQGCLCQAITGVKRLPAEATRLEGRGKPLQSGGMDGLGAVEGHMPTAQIECSPLLGSDLAYTEVIGEIRAAAGGGVIARNRL